MTTVRYGVIRNGEHLYPTYDTATEAEERQREEEGREAQYVERGWITAEAHIEVTEVHGKVW